jgi:tetratricopeptide (TPR) repeat protein
MRELKFSRGLKKLMLSTFIMVFIACGHSPKKTHIAFLEERAFYYYDHDAFNNAIYYLDSLIALDSTKGEYYFKRGYSYNRESFMPAAVRDYEKAARLNYEPADAYRHIALVKMSMDDDSTALVYFNKGLKINPDKFKDIEPLIQSLKSQIEYHKIEAWKEYKKWEKESEKH